MSSYAGYFGKPLPRAIAEKYFRQPAVEYLCDTCKLRWYEPNELGEGDFYATLSQLHEWYYAPDTWDKVRALQYCCESPSGLVVDIGCGNGAFLESLTQASIPCMGVDINREAIATAKARGLDAHVSGEEPAVRCDTLCLFQTIEHVAEPVGFLNSYIRRFRPSRLLLSAPCFETLLGYTSDPLSWPPHHRSAWSAEACRVLAGLTGCRVKSVCYEPLSFDTFQDLRRREPNGRIPGLPRIPNSRLGRRLFALCQYVGLSWATRRHSILVECEFVDAVAGNPNH